MPAQAAVDAWTGDSLHLTTMISPSLTEIGAGVAVNNGKVYYVIDCARPTTSGAPQALITSVAPDASTVTAGVPVAIIPVELSTPNAEGDVVHEVKAGQSLWQIAIAYQVKIDEIRSLNGIAGNDIYPGNKLLIRKGTLIPTASGTAASIQIATPTFAYTPTITATPGVILTSTPGVLASSVAANNSTILKVAIGVLALAFIGGGIVGWFGDSKKKTPPSQ